MKRKLYLFILLFPAACLFFLTGAAQPPDLSRLPGTPAKVQAWIDYCEALRLNTTGAGNNYIVLQLAGLKGLQLATPADQASRSRFFLYTALGYYYQLKFDSAQDYFYRSLRSAQQGRLTKQITRACVALIPVNFQLEQPEKVEECKNILQSIADTTRDRSILKDVDYALGSYYQQKSYYSTAQDYFIKSIQLRENEVDTTSNLKSKFDYAIQCDMLSKLYLNTGMADKSIDILRKANRFAGVSPTVGNRLLSSFVEAYTTSGHIDSALYYDRQLELRTKNNPLFPSEIVSSDLNIALYYMDNREYGKAFSYLQKGDTLAARIGSPLLIYQAQMIKGRYLEETGQSIRAIALLEQALPVARQYSKELYANALKYMALAQKGKGNPDSAVQYYEQYVREQDTLTKEKLSRTFADLETHYQTSQKEQRIATLDGENRLHLLELENASRTRLLLILGLVALGIISLLLYFIYRNKEKVNTVLNRQNDQLEALNGELAVANETKAKLFGIIGHDLRSPVSRIVQLLQLQKENPALFDEQSRRSHEEKLRTASENVLETMEDLLLWSKSQMQYFTPQFQPVDISRVVLKELNFLRPRINEKSLWISNEVPDHFSPVTDENFVSVIIRNLLQNAVKYSDEGSSITIRAGGSDLRITNPSLACAETLNALLHNREVDSSPSGLGLAIANDLARAIRATIVFTRSDDGYLTAVLTWKTGSSSF